MPGVFRPYTLVDVLGTMNQENSDQMGSQVITGFGQFTEADETLGAIDSAVATLTVASTETWDNATWGTITWS